MKRILLSLSIIAVVAVVVAGGTGAFFSDTETSSGNTFTAGAIDLTVDNVSYYNGELNDETTWREAVDLDEGKLFFNFQDLKPGDWGEDTISLHVNNNDAYACVDVRLDSNDDNSLTEPEGDDGDVTDGAGNGELAGAVNFYWWADDGDNVFEDDEELLPAGSLGSLAVGEIATVALADSQGGIFGELLTGDQTYYIGKAWCFGDSEFQAYPQDGENNPDGGPIERPVTCSGANEDNTTQTDSLTATISFLAVQSRNNDGFVCASHLGDAEEEPARTVLGLENKDIDGSWDPFLDDDTFGTLTFISSHPTFDYTLDVSGLVANTNYSIIYYADPWPGNNPGALIGTLLTDGSGDANVSGDVELGMDLPALADANYPGGAKIWVIKSTEYTPNSVNTWPVGAESLFENNLIIYDDTDE